MSTPELSVVLPMPGGYAAIARTMRHLRAQTAVDRIEVLIMTPARGNNALDAGVLDGFAAARVIEYPSELRLSAIRALGVESASAPVVVFAEDHCYPAPEWGEALVRAHAGPYGAVGPQFENANPRSALSWADFYLNFGASAAPAPRGVSTGLAWHNTSYKRALLMERGARLAEMLECEGLLQDELRASGHELWMEPRARVSHVNFSRVRWFVKEHVVSGRLFGANRVREERWSAARRTAYVLTGALTPLARVPRVWREIRRSTNRPALPSMIPGLTLGLFAHAVGEMVGYAAGVGRASEQKSTLEFNRYRYVTARDRAEMIV